MNKLPYPTELSAHAAPAASNGQSSSGRNTIRSLRLRKPQGDGKEPHLQSSDTPDTRDVLTTAEVPEYQQGIIMPETAMTADGATAGAGAALAGAAAGGTAASVAGAAVPAAASLAGGSTVAGGTALTGGGALASGGVLAGGSALAGASIWTGGAIKTALAAGGLAATGVAVAAGGDNSSDAPAAQAIETPNQENVPSSEPDASGQDISGEASSSPSESDKPGSAGKPATQAASTPASDNSAPTGVPPADAATSAGANAAPASQPSGTTGDATSTPQTQAKPDASAANTGTATPQNPAAPTASDSTSAQATPAAQSQSGTATGTGATQQDATTQSPPASTAQNGDTSSANAQDTSANPPAASPEKPATDSAPTNGTTAQPGNDTKPAESGPDTTQTPGTASGNTQPGTAGTDASATPGQIDTAPATPPVQTPPPAPPVYAAQTVQMNAVHDGLQEISSDIFIGADSKLAPHAIRIVAISPTDDKAAPGESALMLNETAADGATKTRPVMMDEQIGSDKFDKLVWNSAINNGGSFRFVPLGQDGKEYAGVAEQQVEVNEYPPAPSYAPQQGSIGIAHDASKVLDRTLFDGTANSPAHIVISSIQADGASDAQAAVLILDKGGTGEKVLSAGERITTADFDKISWDASTNAGGHFEFMPSLADGKPIPGATVQRISVHESPEAPAHESSHALSGARDQVLTLSASIFEGKRPENKPGSIVIDEITENNDADRDNTALFRMDNGQRVAVNRGDTLSAEQYVQLQWDTSLNEGGSLRFSSLDAQGRFIEGSISPTLTIGEYDLPAYPGNNTHALNVGLDLTQAIDRSVFAGTVDDHAPASVRISNIQEQGDTRADASALQMDRNGVLENVQNDQIIAQADFDKLRWNADGSTGGSFQFQALDAQGSIMQGAPMQTVNVQETTRATAEVNGNDVTVYANRSTDLGAVFLASDPNNSSTTDRWFRIDKITGISDIEGSTGDLYYHIYSYTDPTSWNSINFAYAYDLIRVPEGISKADAAARAQAAGGMLLRHHGWNGEMDAINTFLSKHGTSLDQVHHANSADGTQNAFLIYYTDPKLPLQLTSSTIPDQATAIIPSVVIGNDKQANDLDRIIWNSIGNSGGTIEFTEVLGRDLYYYPFSGISGPGWHGKPGTSKITLTINERNAVATKGLDEIQDDEATTTADTVALWQGTNPLGGLLDDDLTTSPAWL